jgi:hypothetical protein
VGPASMGGAERVAGTCHNDSPMNVEPDKLLAKAQELRDRAEEVRNRAEAMTDEKLRMQMMRVAASYQKMAVDLLDTAMKRSPR